jgi:hypothetical protein
MVARTLSDAGAIVDGSIAWRLTFGRLDMDRCY